MDRIELGNPQSPHRTLIIIYTETHELMPSGECRGQPIDKQKKMYCLDGQDRDTALRKLNELLQEIGQTCHNRI